MKVQSHLMKFRRLDAMLGRLDPIADQELWIWTAMNAGINLLNAALHQSGITVEMDSFHTQVEGLYAVPDRLGGEMHDQAHPPGDLMHVGQPALPIPLPPAIERGCAALQVIEDLREPFVRGAQRAKPGEEREWHGAYAACVRELCGLFDERIQGLA